MTLKDSIWLGFSRISNGWLPAARESADRKLMELRERLDEINCSLANKALPEDRRSRVCEMALHHKASVARQRRGKLKAVNGSAGRTKSAGR